MGSVVPDDNFTMILLTSLPETWDSYTSGYLGSNGNTTKITSSDLIVVLLDESRRRKGWTSESGSSGTTLQVKGNEMCECHNCKKKGHLARDCWGKGGGKEGQGPRNRKGKQDRVNQAQDGVPSADLESFSCYV